MTEPLQPPPIRKSVLALVNFLVVRAGLVLVNAGVPKDAAELKLLREVLRLLQGRAVPPAPGGQ